MGAEQDPLPLSHLTVAGEHYDPTFVHVLTPHTPHPAEVLGPAPPRPAPPRPAPPRPSASSRPAPPLGLVPPPDPRPPVPPWILAPRLGRRQPQRAGADRCAPFERMAPAGRLVLCEEKIRGKTGLAPHRGLGARRAAGGGRRAAGGGRRTGGRRWPGARASRRGVGGPVGPEVPKRDRGSRTVAGLGGRG
ncbi:hypothetical protein J1605_020822 [Eschrichtius robustus]|uniref:Uncharacterized protein n=1 Tax=Eschrichtius robustus TaxID=9764 RepID=A0AB34HJ47_ESCRO|nr:hypothetical protein J1605_020822 [Eschrichtius robustus]